MSPRKAKSKENAPVVQTPEIQTPVVQAPVVQTPAAPASVAPAENEVLSQLKRISDHLGFLEKKIDALAESVKNQRPRMNHSFSPAGSNYRHFDRPGFNKRPVYNNDYRSNAGGHSRGHYHGMGHGNTAQPAPHSSHGSGHYHQKFSHHSRPQTPHAPSSHQQPVAYASDPS